MTKPNKLQLTHDEIELTNNDIQDDMGFNEYRATQNQGDFFSSLAECGPRHLAMWFLRPLSKKS